MTQSKLLELTKFLENDLEKVNNIIFQLCQSNNVDLISTIANYVHSAGGKRIRPLLTIASAKILASIKHSSIIPDIITKKTEYILLAAAVEFIHTATLLHDDVIDSSDTRRGRVTSNQIWGNKNSVLVGDYLFTQSFELMVQTGSIEALRVLSNASAIIAEAEIYQLQMLSNINITVEEYVKLTQGKTATLFAAACHVGSIVTLNNDYHIAKSLSISKSKIVEYNKTKTKLYANLYNIHKQLKQELYDFGLSFGIAYQIIDDLLDYYGTEVYLGKSKGQDLTEKKVTLPIILLLKYCNDNEKLYIHSVFSDSNNLKVDNICANNMTNEVTKKFDTIYSKSNEAVVKMDFNKIDLASLSKESRDDIDLKSDIDNINVKSYALSSQIEIDINNVNQNHDFGLIIANNDYKIKENHNKINNFTNILTLFAKYDIYIKVKTYVDFYINKALQNLDNIKKLKVLKKNFELEILLFQNKEQSYKKQSYYNDQKIEVESEKIIELLKEIVIESTNRRI